MRKFCLASYLVTSALLFAFSATANEKCDLITFEEPLWDPPHYYSGSATVEYSSEYASDWEQSLRVNTNNDYWVEVIAAYKVFLEVPSDAEQVKFSLDIFSDAVPWYSYVGNIQLFLASPSQPWYSWVGQIEYDSSIASPADLETFEFVLPDHFAQMVKDEFVSIKLAFSASRNNVSFWVDRMRFCDVAEGCDDICALTVTEKWTATPDGTAPPFARSVEHENGALLALSGNQVYLVEGNGVSFPVHTAAKSSHISLRQDGARFGVYHDGVLTVYHRYGGEVGSAYLPSSSHRLVPGSDLIFAPTYTEISDDWMMVEDALIYDYSGALVTDFPVQNMEISRVTTDHLYYTTHNEMVKTSLSGAELWRVPVKIRKLEVSGEADRIIANSAWEQTQVLHYADGALVSETELGASVWNIAISPSGEYSAATTRDEVFIFADGVQTASVSLPTRYAVSLSISDYGDVAVGGATDAHQAHLLVYSQAGFLLWEQLATLPDNNGWRPEMDFVRSGDGMIVRTASGLTFFEIERSY